MRSRPSLLILGSSGRGCRMACGSPAWGCCPCQARRSLRRTPPGVEGLCRLCAKCHKEDGQGEPAPPLSFFGSCVPPLWGDGSFNGGAGMAKLAYAAAYIQANMPFGVHYQDPVLSEQQAWDVAAYMIAKPRPPAPPEKKRGGGARGRRGSIAIAPQPTPASGREARRWRPSQPHLWLPARSRAGCSLASEASAA